MDRKFIGTLGHEIDALTFVLSRHSLAKQLTKAYIIILLQKDHLTERQTFHALHQATAAITARMPLN